MIYNRGRVYSKTPDDPSNNKEEYSVEMKIFKNTKNILAKVSQLSYQITAIEEILSEFMTMIKKAKDEEEKATK